MNELLKKSATEQSKALKNKEISAVELTNAAFDRIAEVDDKLGAFNSLTKETALNTAKLVDEKIAKGENSGYTGGFSALEPVKINSVEISFPTEENW